MDFEGIYFFFFVLAWTPILLGWAGKRLIRSNHRDLGGWCVFSGIMLAGLQLCAWTFVWYAWDSITWPADQRARYWGLILIALVWGFVHCLIRFIRLASSNAPERS